jgi:lipid II:glycine glycyltransferase (peptidoglycan interpeptide bridge formation enzyme)
LPQEAQLFVAYKDDHVAATQLVLGNGTILYDYLRAASPEFLSIRPNELLFNNIILWAKKTGYKEYSLGGGNSSSESDPLFKFKSSFSPFTKDFYLYKKVHNREAYIKRCVAEGKNPEDVKYEKADYFPEYKTA